MVMNFRYKSIVAMPINGKITHHSEGISYSLAKLENAESKSKRIQWIDFKVGT
jgi:hypothetical protein